MTSKIILHILHDCPPGRTNRDENGRQKMAYYGGILRQRQSSQSMNYALRNNPRLRENLGESFGSRTRRFGCLVRDALVEQGYSMAEAIEFARKFTVEAFGSLTVGGEKTLQQITEDLENDRKHPDALVETSQVVFLGPIQQRQLIGMAIEMKQAGVDPFSRESRRESRSRIREALENTQDCIDLALGGRMMTCNVASNGSLHVEGAMSISHSISVGRAYPENDYFTCVDQLNEGTDRASSGHLNSRSFSSGLQYTAVVIDVPLLIENLGGDVELAQVTIRNLIPCLAEMSSLGNQRAFCTYTVADFMLAEYTERQPYTLHRAFRDPVPAANMYNDAVQRLLQTRENMESCYGYEKPFCLMDAFNGTGSIQEVTNFCVEHVGGE